MWKIAKESFGVVFEKLHWVNSKWPHQLLPMWLLYGLLLEVTLEKSEN